MLIITRRISETVIIGNEEVVIHILGMREGQVKIGLEADRSIPIHRKEIFEKIKAGY
jgi:carbon storage regulator CsrA